MTAGERKQALQPVLLLTNDDGVCPHSALILPFARHLSAQGLDVVVCAPGRNNSACGQRITLFDELTMRRHPEHEMAFAPTKTDDDDGASCGSLSVFSIDEGTPADCVIAAIEPGSGLLAQLGLWPRLVLSGINVGQNLGSDVVYSGTFAAARQAAMYGVPAIALSVDVFTRSPNADTHKAAVDGALHAASKTVHAALRLVTSSQPSMGLRRAMDAVGEQRGRREGCCEDVDKWLGAAFESGDILLNVNIPKDWDGSFTATVLDLLLYRSVPDLAYVPSGVDGTADRTVRFRLSGKRKDSMYAVGSDVSLFADSKSASVTPVSTWPTPHALALPDQFFREVVKKPSVFWQHACRSDHVLPPVGAKF